MGVIALFFVYSGTISGILHFLAVIGGVLFFVIIQRKDLGSIIKNMYLNEKKFILILFFASIACRIFFITSQKSSEDVINDIKVVDFILQNGVLSYFTNYSSLPHIGSQYPPLYPLLLAIIFPFGVTLQYVKLFTIIVGSLIIIPTYLIGKELYDERKASISALIMFALPYPFLMSVQGINDILITFFSAVFMYFYIVFIKSGKISYGILSGIILGLGMLFKYTIGVFYLSTLLFALFYNKKKENNFLSKTVKVILVSLPFILLWILYMQYTGFIENQINTLSALSQPGRKPGSDSGYELYEWFRFVSWAGVLLSPTNTFLLLFFIFHVIYKRKDNWKNSLLLLWVIFPLLFYIILHPLIRYWMVSFSALTLIVANSIEELSRKQFREKIFFTTFVCSLILCFLTSYIVLFHVHPLG
jgi:4-amino-4-deoxy-L-arabinose transferase-like glycosyltransferase